MDIKHRGLAIKADLLFVDKEREREKGLKIVRFAYTLPTKL